MKNLKAMSKRSLALFLAFIMCVSMMQLSVFAAEPEDTTDTSASETTGVNTDTETDADTDVEADTDTDVEDTDVEDTDVEDTDVEDTDVEDTDVEDTDVEDTDVEDTDVDDTDVKNTDVEDTDVEDTDVEDTDVEDTDVEDTDVEDTDVEDTDVDDTDVEDTDVDDTNVEDTDVDNTGVNTPDAGSANPPATDTPVVDTPAVEPPVVNTPPAVEPPAVSTPPAPKAPAVEEVPAEVRAFLKAVAKIPGDINVDNAEKVAELVYGEVSEAYEALLGTEYEDRADVQKAVEAYAAAIEAVEEALELASSNFASGYIPVENVGIYPDKKPAGNTATGKVRYSNQSLTMLVGQRASFLLGAPTNTLCCPTHGYVFAQYNPSDYCDISLIDNSEQGLVGNPSYYAGNNDGERVFDTQFKALKPGTSNDVRVCYYANFGIVFTNGANSIKLVCPYYYYGYNGHYVTINKDVKWYRYNDVFGITVNARYQLNYDSQGGSAVAPTYRDVANTTAILTPSGTPTKQNYTFLGWAERPNATADEVISSATLNWEEGVDGAGNLNGSTANPVSKTLYAVWEETGDDTTYTVTYTDGVAGKTVFPDQGYEGLKEGDETPAFVPSDPTSYTDDAGDTYTFQGWAPTVNPVVSADDDDDGDGEIIYTATWQKQLKNLTVSKTPSEEYPVVGEEFTYTIKVKNPNSDGIYVTITDKLDTKLNVVWDEEYETYGISDSGAYDEDTRTVTWNNVYVPANGDKTVTITVKANAVGEVVDGVDQGVYNEAKVTWDSGETSGNTTVHPKEPDPITRTFKVIYYNESGASWMSVEDSANAGFLNMPKWQMDEGVTENPHDMKVSTNVPTRDGYTFDHWQWGGDVNAKFNPSDTITLTANPETLTEVAADLYAIWTKNPDEYTVTYEWTGLPKDADDLPILPTGGSYIEGAEVEVDTSFQNGDTTSVGGKTYVFSGWTVPSDVAVTGGKFDMPAKDVTISGEWTEQRYNVKYEWTDLPEGAATLPTGGSYTQGAEVTVDTQFAEGTEVEFDGKTYVFSGWTVSGDVTVTGGKFNMPGNDVTITGQWTEKTETTPIIPPVVTYNVTYRWTGLPEGAAALPAGGSYAVGAWVTVNASFSEGTTVTVNGTTYEFSGWDRGSFAMPAADVVIRGSWTAVRTTYTVAHEYYTDGTLDTRNESTYTGEVGSAVDPAAIDRIPNGYRFTSVNPGTVQTLTENGNLTITLRYDRTTGGGGGGGGGGGTDDPDPTPDPDPAPNPDQPTPDVPVADIPEPDVPLVETPEEDVPLGEIPEENVPLTEFPETPVEEEIPDPEVPLADVPRTGDGLGLWLALSLGSALALLCAVFRRKKED